MTQQITQSARTSDLRAAYANQEQDAEHEEHAGAPESRHQLAALRIPVGTNLADVERWMIFATLQKCGGNKTRAAALLGVSLKTLYNRLNAYRAQGLAMDYGLSTHDSGEDGNDRPNGGRDRDGQESVKITELHGELTEVPL